MKVLLSGYGENAFSTLRCKFEVDASTTTVDETAIVWSGGYAAAGVKVRGRSDKTAGVNNDVTLTLAEMTREEALFLAQRLIDYSLMPHHRFRKTRPRAQYSDYVPVED